MAQDYTRQPAASQAKSTRRKWFGRTVNIKEADKQTKIYFGRPLTLKHFLFYAH